MGRVSKRGNSLRKTADIQTELNMEKKRYKAGIYARPVSYTHLTLPTN